MNAARFLARVIPEPNSGCWLWLGAAADGRGYGLVYLPDGKRTGAHRYSWELHRGPVPPGMQVCHRCDVPPCVNPDHLFLGTNTDNVRDAVAKGRAFDVGLQWRTRTHCPSGHAYEGRNLILYQGRRYCRACTYKRNREALS